MQIGSVISSSPVTQISKKVEPPTVAVVEKTVAETVTLDKEDKATHIMRNYDLHNMAYPEVVKMGRELNNAGVITDGQMLMMSAPGGEHLKLVDGKTVFDSNEKNIVYEKKDYLKNQELHLAYVEKYQASDISTITHVKSLVNLLHNLDALNA